MSLKLLLTNNSADSEQVKNDQGLLKFFSQSANDNLVVQIERLKKLGFAGTLQTQQIFTKAMRILFSNSAHQDGRELLRRLLWCTSFDDLGIRNDAKHALGILSAPLEGSFFSFFSSFFSTFLVFFQCKLLNLFFF